MNIKRRSTFREGGKLANTNRQVASKVASLRKIALATDVLYPLTFAPVLTVALYPVIKRQNEVVVQDVWHVAKG